MRKGSRGQVIIIFVLCLLVLVGFAALAVDVGYLLSVRGELQRSADAGALAGAYVFHDGAWQKDDIPKDLRDKADQRARDIASRDPVGGTPLDRKSVSKGGEVDVDFDTGTANQIRVMTNRKLNLFFAGIIGSPTVTLSATATAAAEPVDREVMCLTPLAIPHKDENHGKGKDFKVADSSKGVINEAGKIFPLRFCGDSVLDFFGRIADPCQDKGSCRFQVGDPVPVMPNHPILPTNMLALLGIYRLAFDFAGGDIDSKWEKWEKDLPGSSKYKEDTWMHSPRVMRVILYDKDVAETSGTIIVKGFSAYWVEWKDGDQAKIFTDILIKPDDVKVEGRYLSANAVGVTGNPPAWGSDLKTPSLKITRLVE